jgi:hypothetical protein
MDRRDRTPAFSQRIEANSAVTRKPPMQAS